MRRSQTRKAALALLMLLVLMGADAAGQAVAAQVPQPAPQSPAWVAVVNALAWPVAAIVMALAFRRPLGDFLSGLAGRVTKLSVFKVELELTATPSAAVSPLLDDIRSATTPASISDSTRTMLEQAQSTLPADFAEINLGTGDAWLTSRLFIAAVMLERMRGVQVFVFLESTPGTTRRFVAIAPLAYVRWSLAQQFPWLEAAWARAYLNIFPTPPQGTIVVPKGAKWLPDPRTLSVTSSPIESSSGALSPWQARQLVSEFITLLQEEVQFTPMTSPPSSPRAAVWGTPQSQMQPSVILGAKTLERASWMTRELLETLLPQDSFDLWTDLGRDFPRAQRTRSVLRRPGPFVAMVQGDREYVRLVNRGVLLEEIAASLGEEPE
jgi:hypothetical protein